MDKHSMAASAVSVNVTFSFTKAPRAEVFRDSRTLGSAINY